MSKKLILICAFILMSAPVFAQQTEPKIELPTLHLIQEITLSPSYSCRSSADFQTGYAQTALFLSAYSKRRNSPDLLFNGASKGEDYFQASTAGDDMSLIVDLGENVQIETLSAHKAFNLKGVHSFAEYSKFAANTPVKTNHTYVVLLNKFEFRGLFVFTVTDYKPNQSVTLKYAVKLYDVTVNGKQHRAVGFVWDKGNN